jgi:ABC-type glycerol-3-phosphate transport system permease component
MTARIEAIAVRVVAALVATTFLYPFWWMWVASFRSQEAILSDPLRLWPERFDLGGFAALARIGGVPIATYVVNSLVIASAATGVGVAMMALGAYALHRRRGSPVFEALRYGFLLKVMYPSMLLVIPLYFVSHRFGLLGTVAGIVLVMCVVPLVFFLFVEFFAAIPDEIVDAARIDGASEFQVLIRIVLPLARPVILTATLVAFLINWKQWFPVMVLSTGPETHTLPIALISLNSELGVEFQAIMALATLTVLPVAALFLATQRRVLDGFLSGSLKG